jgi:hypothetical protein
LSGGIQPACRSQFRQGELGICIMVRFRNFLIQFLFVFQNLYQHKFLPLAKGEWISAKYEQEDEGVKNQTSKEQKTKNK